MRGSRFTDEPDHRGLERGGCRGGDRGPVPPPWDLTGDALQVEGTVRWDGVSDARRLRQLEAVNGKLKQLLAESALDNHALRDLLRKNA